MAEVCICEYIFCVNLKIKIIFTNWILNEDLVCLFAWFARSSKIFSQDTELVLFSCRQSLHSV